MKTGRTNVRANLRRRAALAAAVAGAGLGQFPLAAFGVGSAYTGGGAGTPSQPVTGNFSTGFNPAVTAGGSATLELDFSSGTNSYVANDDLAGALSLNQIQLNLSQGGTAPFTVSADAGNSLSFTGTNPLVLQTGTGPVTLNLPVAVTTTTTFGGTAAGTGGITVSGAVSGAGGLVFGGSSTPGTLATSVGTDGGYNTITLSGANTYNGTTTLSAGGLVLDFAGDNTNKLSAAALTLSGGTLTMLGNAGAASSQTVGGTTLNGWAQSVITPGSGQTATFNYGAFARSLGGAIDFGGTGTHTTTTLNTAYTGGTSPASILGGWATFGGGSTFAATSNTAGTNTVTGLSTFSSAFTAATDVDAPIGTSTPAAMTINSLRFNNLGAYTVNTAGILTVASGGILETANVGNNAVVIANNSITTGNAAVDLVIHQYNTANTLTINSVVAGTVANGSAGLTKTGPGTVILGSAANTFTGDVFVTGGTLQFVSSNGVAASGPLGILSGTQGAAFKRVVLTNGGGVRIPTTYNDNAPTTTVQGQVFYVGAGGGVFDIASGQTFTVDDGSGAGTATTASELQGFGDLTVKSTGTTGTNTGTLSLSNGSSNFSAFTGQIFIADHTTVTFGSGGTFGLGSTAGGTTVLSGGVLNMNGQVANIGAEPLTLNGTGINAGGALINSSTTSVTASGPVTLASASSIGGAGVFVLSGAVGGPGSLTKVGTGTVTLSGANTYTGGTVLSAGTLVTNNALALSSGAVTVNAGTLQLSAGGTLTTGTITLNGGSLNGNGNNTITNALAGGTGTANIAPGGIGTAAPQFGTMNIGSLAANNNTNFRFDLTTPSGSNDLIAISGNNAFSYAGAGGTKAVITLDTAPTGPGTYHLFSYSGTSPGVGNFNVATTAPGGGSRVTYSLNDTGTGVGPGFIDLNVTGSNTPMTFNWAVVGSGNWTSGTSWDTNPIVPGIAGDTVNFGTGTGTTPATVTIAGPQKAGTVNFVNTAGAAGTYTLAAGTGGQLFLDNAGNPASINNSNNNNTISAPVVLGGNTTVNVNNGTTLTIGTGGISGGGNLTVGTTTPATPGTLLLTGAGTYTGTTTVTGATAKLGIASGLSTTAVLVNAGGTVDINNFGPTNAFTLNGAGVGGAGAMINSSGTGNPTVSGAVTLASNTTLGVTSNFVISGAVSGSGVSLTKIGAGQLSLNNGGNSFSGGLIVNAGTVATNSGDVAFGAAGAPITLNGTGVGLTVNQASQVTNTHPITLTAGTTATLSILQNQKWLFSNVTPFSGPSTATITRTSQAGSNQSNVMQVTQASPYAGAWVLNGGVIEVQNANALGDASATNTVTINNTLSAATFTEIGAQLLPQNVVIASTSLSATLGADNQASTFSGSITANGNFNARLGSFFNTAGQNLNFTGPLSGSGVMTIIASQGGSLSGQVLTLSGNNSGYTAAISIPANAVIAAANPNALGATTAGTTVVSGGALDIQAPLAAEPITVGGTGISSSGALRNSSVTDGGASGPITLSADTSVGISGAGGLNLAGNIGGAFNLTKVGTGAGVLTLGGTNTFGGAGKTVTISGGVLAYGADNNLGDPANAVTLGGGTLRYTGATAATPRTININAGANGIDVSSAATTYTVPTAFGGATAGSLNKLGAGALALTAAAGSGYTGGTTVSNGTLVVGNTSGSATGTGAVTFNAGVLASPATASGGNGTPTGIITGSVNAGTGFQTVAPGGVDPAADATGLFVGNLTLGSLTTNSRTTLNFDLDNGPGVLTNDLLSLNNTLTVGAGTRITFDANPSAAGTYKLINVGSGTPTLNNFVLPTPPSGTTYILNQAGTAINLVVGTGTVLSSIWTGASGTDQTDWNDTTNWTAGVPNGMGQTATFPASAPGGTVNLNGDKRVGFLNLDTGSGGAYTLASGAPATSTLVLDNGTTSPAVVTVNSGTHTISAPVNLFGNATVGVPNAGDSLTFAGPVSGGGGLSKTGGGNVVVSGQATYTGGGTVSGGVLQLTNTTAGSTNSITGGMTVAAGGTLRVSALGNGATSPTAAPNNALGTAGVTLNGGTLAIDPTSGGTAGSFNTKFITAPNTNNLVYQLDYIGLGTLAGSPATVTGQAGQTGLGIQFNANPANTTATAWYTGGPTLSFLARLTGAIKITTAGNYVFQENSDDAARVYIDNQLVILNDGGHGLQATAFSSPTINLSAGLHEFRVDYTQGNGGDQLFVNYAGADTGGTGTFLPVTSSVVQTQDNIAMGNNVSLTASSTIDLGTNSNFTQVGLGSLAFNQGAGNAATLSVSGLAGKNIHFAGGFTLQQGATSTISNTPDVFLDGQALLSAAGTATLVKSGPGQLFVTNTLSTAPNNLSGATINVQSGRFVAQGSTSTAAAVGNTNPIAGAALQLSGGTLVLDSKAGSNNAVGPTFDNPVTVTANSAIEVQPTAATTTLGGVASGNGIAIATGTTLTVNPYSTDSAGSTGAILSVPGPVTGGGALTLTPLSAGATNLPGTLVLTGTNNYSGGTTVTAGILQGNTNGLQGAITNNGSVVFDQNFAGTFAGSIGGGGTLTVQNTGTVTAPGANFSYSGSTNLNNGVLALSSSTPALVGALNFGSTNAITTVGTLDLTAANATFGSMVVQTNSVNGNLLKVGPAQTLTINGNVTIGSSQGANTTTVLNTSGGGSFVVNNGAANGIFTVGGTSGTSAVGNIARADLSGLGTLSISLNTTSGAVTVNPNITTGTTNVNGLFSTLTLPSTGPGNTTITASRLDVGVGPTFNSVVTQVNMLKLGTGANVFNVNTVNIGAGTNRDMGAVVFNTPSGSIKVRAADTTSAAAFNLGTGGTTTATAGATNTFDVSGHTADLLFGATGIGTETRSGTYSNVFSFDKGTLTMLNLTAGTRSGVAPSASMTDNVTINLGSAASTAADTATITNGILSFGVSNPAAAAFNATVNATLNIGGGTVNVGATGGTSVTMATATAATSPNVNAANATIAITGGVANFSGNILKGSGSGTGFATSAVLTLNGGTLNLNNNSIGSAATPLDTLNFQSGTLMNVAAINGSGGLTKITNGLAGGGVLALSGTVAYTGATAVNAGTLLANGTITNTSSVTVASSATLGGSGTIAGPVNILAGGKLSPGNSPGQLTLTGNAGNTSPVLSLTSSSNLIEELTASATPGAGYDQVVVTGTSGANAVDLGGSNLVLSGSTDPAATYVLIDNQTPAATANQFATLPEGSVVTVGGNQFTVTYAFDNGGTGNANDVALVPVPEPAAAGVLGLAAIGLLARRRRRAKA